MPLRFGHCATAIIIVSFISCAKSTSLTGTSALTIVNAIPGSNPLTTNFLGSSGSKTTELFTYYSSALQIGYGSFAEISSHTGTTHLAFSQISDTLTNIANFTFSLRIGGIYSLFMTGADTLHIDSLLTQDVIPYYPYTGDSLTGIRFVNLSKWSNPISIDIQGSPNIELVSSLSYKVITTFQPLSANGAAQANGYNLEFRDEITDSVLATYSINIVLFESQTLAFYGTANTGLSVMSINNF